MRRNLVIFVCILNSCLAAGLLWYFLSGTFKSKSAPLPPPQTNSELEPLSEDQLWTKVLGSSNTNEAFYYLKQFESPTALRAKIKAHLLELFDVKEAAFPQWPSFLAAIQIYSDQIQSLDGLKVIAQVAQSKTLPLTLRDAAFRKYIENLVRLKETSSDSITTAHGLIGEMLIENNSLQGTALHAEHYLLRDALLSKEREKAFTNRLLTIAQSSLAMEGNRMIALKILTNLNKTSQLSLEKIYLEGSSNLKIETLKAILEDKSTTNTNQWVENIEPQTPEEEALKWRILNKY